MIDPSFNPGRYEQYIDSGAPSNRADSADEISVIHSPTELFGLTLESHGVTITCCGEVSGFPQQTPG
jgi:hypothetical protein